MITAVIGLCFLMKLGQIIQLCYLKLLGTKTNVVCISIICISHLFGWLRSMHTSLGKTLFRSTSLLRPLYCEHVKKVSSWQFYRAKKKANEGLIGSIIEHYNKMWDYCEEIKPKEYSGC